MCGICGIINFDGKPVEERSIRTMLLTMKHRGPDDDGLYTDHNAGFGFVRLSILDLSSSGHQPMFDDSGRYMIIFNGEVYNYVELREELKQSGYTFQSNTDTEVILKAYLAWGEACLHKFNGMWAMAIYDTQKKEIFISRDRYGIKPFYYYYHNNTFIFASEPGPILQVLPEKPKANMQAVFDYLVFNRTDHNNQTFFSEIKKLPHGYNIKVNNPILDQNKSNNNQNHLIIIYKWYDLQSAVFSAVPFKDAGEYHEIFSSSVGLRLRSDVPIGVCLSGGLDSSAIVSTMMHEFGKTDVNTFSAIYGQGKRGDESIFIDEYKPLLSEMFFTQPDAESQLSEINNFVKAHQEPIPTTEAYAQYRVMKLAAKHAVVTLDGQGADEQLTGYHYFYGYWFKDLLKQAMITKLINEMVSYSKMHKSLYGFKTLIYYLLPQALKTKVRVINTGYLTDSFADQFKRGTKVASGLYNAKSLNQSLLNHFEYKLEHLLKWEDRNSMFHSLESRVPFLDHRLVEKTLALSGKQLIYKGWTKHILREAMKDTVPEKIRLRKDKVGFATPEDEWFRTKSFQDYIFGLLESDTMKQRNIINTTKAVDLYKKHLNREVQASKEIWKWIHLELWFRTFID